MTGQLESRVALVTGASSGIGRASALALAREGAKVRPATPVMAYYTHATTRDLKVMHCNDPNCGGGNDSIETPDTGGDVGSHPSLALNGDVPVVSYYDTTNDDLRVLRCDDANCTSGLTTSIDTASDSGENNALVLDASHYPAISYDADFDLKLVRCSNTSCIAPVGGVAELSRVTLDAGTNSRTALYVAIAALVVLVAGVIALRLRLS